MVMICVESGIRVSPLEGSQRLNSYEHNYSGKCLIEAPEGTAGCAVHERGKHTKQGLYRTRNVTFMNADNRTSR